MKRTKYKHSFDGMVINNRWKRPFYSRSDSWVVIGIGIRYFSIDSYEYYLSLFGIDIRIFFKKQLKITNK